MKKLLIILIVLFFPVSTFAAFSVGWNATSTNIGSISPNKINGNNPFIKVNYIQATSTTATSTFAGGLAIKLLNVTSTTATSTFADGINLTAGCFSISSTCIGTGNVVSTSTATDNAIARFDGTTGKLIQNSSLTIDDSGSTLTFGNGFYINATGVIADFIPYISNDASNFSFVPNGIGGFSMSANTIVGINPALVGGAGSGRTLQADPGVGTNLAGGDLTLASGISSGSAMSSVLIKAAPSGTPGTGSNTPTQVASFGTASTTFSNPYFIVSTGSVGIGTTSPSATLSLQSGTSAGDVFTVATTTAKYVFGIDNAGHRFSSGPAPAISSCGTGTGTVLGDDQGGTITTATAATSCTLTFAKAYTGNGLYCTISDDSLVGFADIASTSTTAVVFGISSALTGGHLYYSCAYHR